MQQVLPPLQVVGTLMAVKTEGRDELLAPVPALVIELGV
jgi:hypothetical protein